MRLCRSRILVMLLVASLGGGCTGSPSPNSGTALEPPTQDAATRTMPVVPGRPARVFVFAGWDTNCAALAAPRVTVTIPPRQGEITFRVGQQTTIAASTGGTCNGRTVAGTGVYYTAREGAAGEDRFAVEAQLASGETNKRTFAVTIAP